MTLIRKKVKHAGWIWLDPNDHGVGQRLNAQGYREPGFMWMLEHEARGVAVDVGANIGYCTLTMARRCKLVMAYEPDARSYLVLARNVGHLPNVATTAAAFGNSNGKIRFVQAERPNLSRVATEGTTEVKVLRLDTVFGPGDVNFIKMDVEGGEVGVIQGGRCLFAESPKMKIAMELHPDRYGPENDMLAEFRWLIDAGYRFRYVENAKEKVSEFTSLGLKPCKRFSHTDRAIFRDVPETETLLRWCTEMPDDARKVVRSVLLVKE